MAGKNSTLITTRGLRRTYQLGETEVLALDGVDLVVREGEFLCIMGPSGSGKSTMLTLLGGLDRPDDGTIVVGGQEITAHASVIIQIALLDIVFSLDSIIT